MNVLIKFLLMTTKFGSYWKGKGLLRVFYCILFDIPLAFWVLVRTHMM